MRGPLCGIMAWLGLFAGSATAHYNMLLPQTASAKKGETLTITYQWGHPFEHQLFDAPQPESLVVLLPDGKQVELVDKLLVKTTRKAGEKEVTAYQLSLTPQQRGDHVFVLRTPPIWMEEDGEFLQDTVKMVLHVQAQKRWDSTLGEFELVPLTRPYGLRPGTVFQVEIPPARRASKGDPSSRFGLVEIERYNATPPKKLPPDEEITRTVRLDANGVATATLDEAGWWCLTVARPHGTRMRDGKSYPLRQRATFWVFVDEPANGRRQPAGNE
jgi:cobalt/nickel transport protein